ncbi:pro-cathepsin H [Acrasis kona]|uniref:Pro-cathepsin H n=1 Tax=Acrasis kona TaxID=1008807 RepID=A0AAW2ZCI1_9EUKA
MMTKVFYLLCILAAVFAVTISEDDHKEAFSKWALEYGKKYDANENVEHRYNLFKKYRNEIFDHNEKAAQGIYTWTKKVDQFADWTDAEKDRFLNYVPENFTSTPEALMYVPDNADYVDWTQRGAVVNGKDQGQCGSCWAFAATGSMEGCNAIAGKGLKRLSEQQLQDCLYSRVCSPGGGSPGGSIDWVRQRGGISGEAQYPYLRRNGQCHDTGKVARVGNVWHVNRNEGAMVGMVQRGPTAAGINGQALFGYHQGVINDDRASKATNHAILIVGYAPNCENTGVNCWIIRNSWGSGWGKGGYGLVARNKNTLGIGSDAHTALDC